MSEREYWHGWEVFEKSERVPIRVSQSDPRKTYCAYRYMDRYFITRIAIPLPPDLQVEEIEAELEEEGD